MTTIDLSELLAKLSKCSQDAFVQCTSYQGNPDRPKGKQPAIPIMWSGFARFAEARDGLNYRNEALIWHASMLQRQIVNYQKQIEETAFDDSRNFHIQHGVQSGLGFMLDDIVFNSMSAFDYLPEFIFAAHIPNYRGDKRWSVLMKNKSKISHSELLNCLEKAETSLVKPLNRYRGHVIHNKPEAVELGLKGTYGKEGLGFEHDMPAPKKFLDLINIVEGNKVESQVEIAAFIFLEQCFKYQIDILVELSVFEYKARGTK